MPFIALSQPTTSTLPFTLVYSIPYSKNYPKTTKRVKAEKDCTEACFMFSAENKNGTENEISWMTAISYLETGLNWLMIAAVIADTVHTTGHKCIYIRLRHRSHSSWGSNLVWTATDNQQAATVCSSTFQRQFMADN